ncbi:hypothetical protein OAF75_04440, partial [Verrucomicrobiales bacterium]|nr:hypothetical protein [Verrucomicrobiales bacterium]
MKRSHMNPVSILIIIAVLFYGTAVAQDEEKAKTEETAPKEEAAKKEAETPEVPQRPIDPNADLLQTGPRLSKEARRQDNVGRKTRTIAKRMKSLLLDLQSNGLIEQGNGEELEKTGALLLAVARTDVPAVAGKLRQAQANIDGSLPHIKGAEEDIGKVIANLDKVLEGAKSILVDDRLIRELSEIIKAEELLKKGSIDWIRKMQVNPDSKNLDRGRLSRVQEAVINRYAEFFDLLVESKEASKGTAAGDRFEATEKSLTGTDPEALMSSAVDNILKDQALAAGTDQGKAIEALRIAQKILSAEEDSFDDLINAIQHLIAVQRELKEDTEPPVADANAPKANLFND